MGGFAWPLAFVAAFGIGAGVVTYALHEPAPARQTADVTVAPRAADRVATPAVATPSTTGAAPATGAAATPGAPAVAGAAVAPGSVGFSGERAPGGVTVAAHSAAAAGSPVPQRATPSPAVQSAIDRLQRFLDATKSLPEGRERFRQYSELVRDLKAMGEAGAQALLHSLVSGGDADERRLAARLLGQLGVAEAAPLFKQIIENDDDVLMQRAAASGLRQLQTPESIAIMERFLSSGSEDRFVRLSAAAGLADAGKPSGVNGLARIFEESTADGRGRDIAFRALANLKDKEQALPFMRSVLDAQIEPGYRRRAIDFLMANGDVASIDRLETIARRPGESPSIRDAAADAARRLRTPR